MRVSVWYHLIAGCPAGIVLVALAATAAAGPSPTPAPVSANSEAAAAQEDLANIEAQIASLKHAQSGAAGAVEAAAQRVERLSAELAIAELQLQQTLLTVAATTQSIDELTVEIEQLNQKAAAARNHLGQVVRALYEHELTTPIDIVLSTVSLSGVLSEQRTYETLQQRTLQLIRQLRATQQAVASARRELNDRRSELERLKTAQAYQQADLAEQRATQQARFARAKQAHVDVTSRLTEAAATRQEIAQKIFTLRGVELTTSLTDAFSAARYAASLTGVKPSLLLAVLKVETNVGANLGSGVFPDDMHPDSREPFLRLTAKLGRDPHDTPISRRPTLYQGWGGAIGPGQFMPQTWELHEPRLRALMGQEAPDPFALPDALVAVGVMLADRGAADPARVVEAVARFLAGPNWMYHTWYSTRVLAVAEEYVREGLE